MTDTSGQRTKGKVADVSSSPPSVVILVPQPRTFPESAVAEIRAVDSLRNGALIGSSVGLGLAVWDYLIDPSEPGNAAIFAVAIGLGAAIGTGRGRADQGQGALSIASTEAPRDDFTDGWARSARGVVVRPFLARFDN